MADLSQEMNPKVSIIIPTYNYGRYIEGAIESALNQSYDHIEVIVVDDGSADDTQARLGRYRGDARITLLSQPNRGAAAARNRGLREATGAFIAFLDADDRYRPDNIAKKVAFLNAHSEFRWCYSNWVWVDEEGRPFRSGSEPGVSLARLKASGEVLPLALQGYRLGTNVFLFRREVLDAVEGFDESLAVLEDFDLYLRAAASFPLGFVDEELCEIHEHEGSLGTGAGRRQAYYSRWLLHRKIARLYPSKLQAAEVATAWKRQQADLYRNLAELALLRGNRKRARVFARASMSHRLWQPGIVGLWVRIGKGGGRRGAASF